MGRQLAPLSAFATDLAHEINSPLAAAMSEIGFVVTRRGSETQREEALAAALESLSKVRRIVERVQRLGDEVESKGAFPLDVLVRDVCERLASLVALRGASLELDLQSTRPLHDAARMAPVVTELVTGAMRAVVPGGRIAVRLRQLSRRVLLIVHDSGTGPRACDPICQTVVSSLGGTLDVDSNTGIGTEVVISVPNEPIALFSSNP